MVLWKQYIKQCLNQILRRNNYAELELDNFDRPIDPNQLW